MLVLSVFVLPLPLVVSAFVLLGGRYCVRRCPFVLSGGAVFMYGGGSSGWLVRRLAGYTAVG